MPGYSKMDWIERFFHIAPDGGNGVTELLILIALLGATSCFGAIRARRKIKRSAERNVSPIGE